MSGRDMTSRRKNARARDGNVTAKSSRSRLGDEQHPSTPPHRGRSPPRCPHSPVQQKQLIAPGQHRTWRCRTSCRARPLRAQHDHHVHPVSSNTLPLCSRTLSMLQIQTQHSTVHVLIALPQEKHTQLMDNDHIRRWLACYNLKSRVRGIEDRSSLDNETVR